MEGVSYFDLNRSAERQGGGRHGVVFLFGFSRTGKIRLRGDLNRSARRQGGGGRGVEVADCLEQLLCLHHPHQQISARTDVPLSVPNGTLSTFS